MENKLFYTITQDFITLVYNGQGRTLTLSSDECKRAFLVLNDETKSDAEKFSYFFNERDQVAKDNLANISQKLDSKLEIKHDTLYYRGVEIRTQLASAIVDAVRENKNVEILLKFFYNLEENPSLDSRLDLFKFLTSNKIPITEDGHIVAMKAVNSEFYDKWTGTILNKPGSTIEKDRAEVCADSSKSCAEGLHVGGRDYMTRYLKHSDNLLLVKVHPKDVVSVPNSDETKMRVCKYYVMKKVPQHFTFNDDFVYHEDVINYFDLRG